MRLCSTYLFRMVRIGGLTFVSFCFTSTHVLLGCKAWGFMTARFMAFVLDTLAFLEGFYDDKTVSMALRKLKTCCQVWI